MINFKRLKIEQKSGFVGFSVSQKSHKSEIEEVLRIPLGYPNPDKWTWENKKEAFFLLYRLLRTFELHCLRNQRLERNQERISYEESVDILRNTDVSENGNQIFYSSFTNFDKVIDAYDELKIFGLMNKVRSSHKKLDYNRMHRDYSTAIFLEEDVVFIQKQRHDRKEIVSHSTSIIQLYCYIYSEITTEMRRPVRDEIVALAAQYKNAWLYGFSSLFSEEGYDSILEILKSSLSSIHKHTLYKDPDYWVFHDAIRSFLYGTLCPEQGQLWGMRNFWPVWECLCICDEIKLGKGKQIFVGDAQFIPQDSKVKIESANKYNACIFSIKTDKRKGSDLITDDQTQLRPDLVLWKDLLTPSNSLVFTSILHLSIDNDWNDDGIHIKYKLSFNSSDLNISKLEFRIMSTKATLSVPSILKSGERLDNSFLSCWDIEKSISSLGPESTVELAVRLNHVCYASIRDTISLPLSPANLFVQDLSLLAKKLNARMRVDYAKFTMLFRKGSESVFDLSRKVEGRLNLYLQHFFNALFNFELYDPKYERFLEDSIESHTLKKLTKDIRKQMVYEFLIQEHYIVMKKMIGDIFSPSISSTFILPGATNSALNSGNFPIKLVQRDIKKMIIEFIDLYPI